MKILNRNFFSLALITSLVVNFFLFNVSSSQAVGAASYPQAITIPVTISGTTYNLTVGAGSDADQVTTTATTISVLISTGQRFRLTSNDRLTLNTNSSIPFSCDTTQSSIDVTLSAGASQTTVVVTPSSTVCSGSASGGGSGGGSATPVSSTPTPNPTASPITTPSVSVTATPSPLSTSAPIPLLGASLAKLYRKSGDSKVYVVQANGLLKWVKSLEDFNSAGYKWTNLKVLPAKDFSKLKIDISSNAPVLATPVSISNHIRIKGGVKLVNIRSSNSTKGKIVGRALNGQEFEFTDFQNGWYKIDSGWIFGAYVKKF